MELTVPHRDTHSRLSLLMKLGEWLGWIRVMLCGVRLELVPELAPPEKMEMRVFGTPDAGLFR